MENINWYVKTNWATLPKSNFNSDEVVIVKEITNEDYGWGHHVYEGIGVDQEGKTVWCFSSGCSCNGWCGTDHKATYKSLQLSEVIHDVIHQGVNFNNLQVSYSDY